MIQVIGSLIHFHKMYCRIFPPHGSTQEITQKGKRPTIALSIQGESVTHRSDQHPIAHHSFQSIIHTLLFIPHHIEARILLPQRSHTAHRGGRIGGKKGGKFLQIVHLQDSVVQGSGWEEGNERFRTANTKEAEEKEDEGKEEEENDGFELGGRTHEESMDAMKSERGKKRNGEDGGEGGGGSQDREEEEEKEGRRGVESLEEEEEREGVRDEEKRRGNG